MGLELTSTVKELPVWDTSLDVVHPGKYLNSLFDAEPLLPGIILTHEQRYSGMISRRQFFELMSRPYSLELFLRRPIDTLYGYIHAEILILHHDTSIAEAIQQALQRSPACMYEPMLVEFEPGTYRVLDFQQLLLAQLQVHSLSLSYLQRAEEGSRTVEASLRQLQRNYANHLQTEKMAALGQLVAGVAHEINNPVNFIHGNLVYADHYISDLLQIVDLYQQEHPHASARLQAKLEATDFEFIKRDLPKLWTSLEIGVERIQEIVKSLRTFSRLDEADRKVANIHDGIESTLVILKSRIKATSYRADIELTKDYGDLPLVECYPGKLNQVFMNILVNAIDALDDYCERQGGPLLPDGPSKLTVRPAYTAEICIRTRPLADDWIEIAIADNGPGIAADSLTRLFDPFFSTKPVGQGTGLGLAISHQIITEDHAGQLLCRSEPGRGAEFVMQLPIHVHAKDRLPEANPVS